MRVDSQALPCHNTVLAMSLLACLRPAKCACIDVPDFSEALASILVFRIGIADTQLF